MAILMCKREIPILWASRLAEMAICERRVVLQHKLGRRSTSAQRNAMRAGRREHAAMHRESLGCNFAVKGLSAPRCSPRWVILLLGMMERAPRSVAVRATDAFKHLVRISEAFRPRGRQ